MALWGKQKIEADKPKYLSNDDKAKTSLVRIEDSQEEPNREKGINTPGWVIQDSYTDVNGTVRYKSEVLVALAVTKAESGGDAPVLDEAPELTGIPEVGEELSVTEGTWESLTPVTFEYQWKRNGTNISGETGTTYVLVEGDIGASISVTVVATNDMGSTPADSNSLGPIEGVSPINVSAPEITGNAIVGETLTASNGTWTGIPAPTFTLQWKKDGVNISGATATTYVIDAADENGEITVEVTAANSAGSNSATSAAVGPVTTE